MKLLNLLLASLLMPACMARAQQVHNLVLEGGGSRGVAYTGAFLALDSAGVLLNVKRVAGTSAGALQAMLLATGHSALEVYELTRGTRLQRFNDGRLGFIGGFIRLRKQYGWYRGDAVLHWCEDRLLEKTGDCNLTFAALHELAGKGLAKDLYITATNLTRQQVEVFSHETYPNMRIADAVRISTSIPYYYRAPVVDLAGSIYKVKDAPAGASVMVDGGILANYPLFLFDSLVFSLQGDSLTWCEDAGRYINHSTLGLRVDRTQQVLADLQSHDLSTWSISGINDFTSALYTVIIETLNRRHMDDCDWPRTISIDIGNTKPKVRRLKKKEKQFLVGQGKKAVEGYFSRTTDKH